MSTEYDEILVSEAITEKPIEFTVGKQKFEIKPPTFGKLQLLSRLYLMLEIDEDALIERPHKEVMQICETKTDIVCELMATITFESKEDLLDSKKIKERTDFFKWNSRPEHYSMVLMAILTQNDHEGFISSIRLTKYCRLNKPSQEK